MFRGLILNVGGMILELLIGDKANSDEPKIIVLKYICFLALCIAGCFIPVIPIKIIMGFLIAITVAIAIITEYLNQKN